MVIGICALDAPPHPSFCFCFFFFFLPPNCSQILIGAPTVSGFSWSRGAYDNLNRVPSQYANRQVCMRVMITVLVQKAWCTKMFYKQKELDGMKLVKKLLFKAPLSFEAAEHWIGLICQKSQESGIIRFISGIAHWLISVQTNCMWLV